MKITRLSLATLLSILSLTAFAADNAIEAVLPVQSSANSVFLSQRAFGGPAPSSIQEMAERLKDPAQRAQLRAEHRENIQSQHADLNEVMSIDAQTFASVIDVLTDRQMAHLDSFYAYHLDPSGRPSDDFNVNNTEAESHTRQQIRTLLGEERFGRYLDFEDWLSERQQANYFNARLAAEDKLDVDQKARLMALLRDYQHKRVRVHRQASGSLLRGFGPGASTADFQAALQKQNVALNEEGFREMQTESRQLLERLAGLLTDRQLDTYRQQENEKLAGQRKFVQQMRVSAGMTPEFDETPAPEPAARVLVTGKVKVELSLAVNGDEPTITELITENGTASADFKTPAGLWARVTPTLYDDGWANIEIKFSEDIAGRRRSVRGGLGMAMQVDPRGVLLGRGRSSTSVSGSKAYTVSMDARVSPVQ